MSFADCILGKAGHGLVSREAAERAAKRFEDLAEPAIDFSCRWSPVTSGWRLWSLIQ